MVVDRERAARCQGVDLVRAAGSPSTTPCDATFSLAVVDAVRDDRLQRTAPTCRSDRRLAIRSEREGGPTARSRGLGRSSRSCSTRPIATLSDRRQRLRRRDRPVDGRELRGRLGGLVAHLLRRVRAVPADDTSLPGDRPRRSPALMSLVASNGREFQFGSQRLSDGLRLAQPARRSSRRSCAPTPTRSAPARGVRRDLARAAARPLDRALHLHTPRCAVPAADQAAPPPRRLGRARHRSSRASTARRLRRSCSPPARVRRCVSDEPHRSSRRGSSSSAGSARSAGSSNTQTLPADEALQPCRRGC